MKNTKNSFIKSILIAVLCGTIIGCSVFNSTISTYDSIAYTQTTAFKVDAMDLMDLAKDSIQNHEKDISMLQHSYRKIYEYEKHRPKNEITVGMWETLMDSSGTLYGNFLREWRSKKICNQGYINSMKKQIGKNFDDIAELESRKIK